MVKYGSKKKKRKKNRKEKKALSLTKNKWARSHQKDKMHMYTVHNAGRLKSGKEQVEIIFIKTANKLKQICNVSGTF